MRRVSPIAVLFVFVLIGATGAVAQPVPYQPCAADYPEEAEAATRDGPGHLTVRLRVTGADADGRICLLTGDRALVDEHRGPYAANQETVVGWNLGMGNYTVVFNQTDSPTWGAGARSVNLTACLDGAAIVWFNLTHMPGVMVAFTAYSKCTYGPAPDRTPADAGNHTGDNGTGASQPGQNETAPNQTASSDPPAESVAEEASKIADGASREPHAAGEDGGKVLSMGGGRVSVPAEAVAAGVVVTGLLGLVAAVHYGPALRFVAASLLGRRLVGAAEEHPVRQRVLTLLRAEPGLHANAIRQRLELGSGQTMHHLGILVNHSLLVSIGRGGFRRFFPAGMYGAHEKRALAALRRRNALPVYERLAARPGIRLKDVAREVELPASTVTKVVKRLREADVVEGDPKRGTLRVRGLSAAVRNALET